MSYKDILDEAWAQHLAPRAADAPTVISTFAGCGGSSLGYSMAGFRELLAVEWDDHAVATFKLNFPEVPVFHGDIARLDVDRAFRMTGLEPGELDVLDGSPPCQGFSISGKRMMDDLRNQLFREYVRLLTAFRPKVFVMENVGGMVRGKMKLIFAEILRELKSCNYNVSVRLMDAAYFNVPQHRSRMIFIGTRNDLKIKPGHPTAQSAPVSAGCACLGVCNTTFNRSLVTVAMNIWKSIRPGQTGETYRPGYYMNVKKVDPKKPSLTICKVLPGTGGLLHWIDPRSLTIEELKRIGSFPDQFRFTGKFDQQWTRIGNSVPPLLMRAIARHVRSHILDHIARSDMMHSGLIPTSGPNPSGS